MFPLLSVLPFIAVIDYVIHLRNIKTETGMSTDHKENSLQRNNEHEKVNKIFFIISDSLRRHII